jgi:Phytanoyl-CoA dioxygenase (PhyH)
MRRFSPYRYPFSETLMPLTPTQLARFRVAGHLTVPAVFTPQQVDDAIADATAWGRELLAHMTEADRARLVDRHAGAPDALRKLDDPVYHRPIFRGLASHPPLVEMIEQLIGPGLSVAFSQVFFKPPGGGPKPAHQDNFYFGPNDPNGLVTVWIALDEATVNNGCLVFAEGTQHGPVVPHTAPPDEPFNLQIGEGLLVGRPFTPAPVPRGGVSFHHGNVFHASSANPSPHWRRAAALHYVNATTTFATPAWEYDMTKVVKVGE